MYWIIYDSDYLKQINREIERSIEREREREREREERETDTYRYFETDRL